MKDQSKAPVHDALLNHRINRIVHFDVPSHKGGKGNKILRDFLGEKCLKVDVNSMKPLDNLCHPVSVIKEAEELAADAFGAHSAFFIVNGTTQAVQAMIMATVKENEKIILPRNVHRSAINALVVNGAIPIYVNPGTDNKLGIPLGMSVFDVKKAIEQNKDAKAILVNNPTYYGICSNLKEIVKLAHENNMKVLVDEAHGTHFYFGENMPVSAMAAGADMAAVSVHKTGNSLTQSSLLLMSCNVNADYVRQIINLTQTTSGSYLLISSLDISRQQLYLNGKQMYSKLLNHVNYARGEINKFGGYYAFGKELIDNNYIYDFDETKLSIHTRDLGLAGVEVYDILRDDYDIQIEFGDIGNILAIVSAGDRELELERLLAALLDIKRKRKRDKQGTLSNEYISPKLLMTPKKAFFSNKKSLPLRESVGKIASEFVMCYPPGIPIIAPGELMTDEILEYILYAKEKGSFMTGTEDMHIENINIVEE